MCGLVYFEINWKTFPGLVHNYAFSVHGWAMHDDDENEDGRHQWNLQLHTTQRTVFYRHTNIIGGYWVGR